MTTYPLSEQAAIRRTGKGGNASRNDEVVGRGSLEHCADIVEAMPAEERSSLRIDVDDIELHDGSEEIEELLIYLRDESAGLSNKEVSEIEDPDR